MLIAKGRAPTAKSAKHRPRRALVRKQGQHEAKLPFLRLLPAHRGRHPTAYLEAAASRPVRKYAWQQCRSMTS